MRQGRERGLFGAVILVLAMLTFLGSAYAAQYIVGGDVPKWNYLHATSKPSFYQDWADTIAFKTGDTLLFSYDNSTHSVYRLGTASDFTSCNLGTVIPGGSFHSGQDIVFLSTPDTYYFVCGAPSHCKQGMKFALSATGSPISAPPPPPVGSDAAAPGSQASLTVTRPGSVSLSICISVAAFVSIFLWRGAQIIIRIGLPTCWSVGELMQSFRGITTKNVNLAGFLETFKLLWDIDEHCWSRFKRSD